MEMRVSTKEEFAKACNEKPQKIILEGEIAEQIKRSIKAKKTGKAIGIGGGALALVGIIGGIVAAPITMGTSLGVTAAGIAGLTVGTVTLTTVEVAIVAGVIVSGFGVSLVVAKDVLKHYDINIGNGTVVLNRKN